MKILVTGGTGYIGSHTVVELLNRGDEVVIVDNLSNSNREVLNRIKKITGKSAKFYEIDLRDKAKLDEIFANEKPSSVIHFAGLKAVGESVAKPLEYYDNNLISTIKLLEIMKKHDVKNLIFSSSATVYGEPSELPLKETSRVGVGLTNPYGWTKYFIEQILRDIVVAEPDFNITILRYFNPVGAHESGEIGEDPGGIPNNLLPFVSQVAVGIRKELKVFGDDYDTPDGTGIRDYIHVVDLAKGHLAALAGMNGLKIYNLSTGRGVSVLQLVKNFEKASGCEIPYEIVARRPGDIAECYASSALAKKELGWQTEKTLLDGCRDTWRWQSQNPRGFKD